MKLKQIKYTFLYLLVFLLGGKITYAKTELILPQTAVSFSIESTQFFTSLEKDELHISSVLHSVDKNIVDILPAEDLRKYVNEEYIKHQLAKKLANKVGKFTAKQIDDYVLFATKQGDQSKVMLGKFEGAGNPLSYTNRAGTNHSYFDMGNKWDEALEAVNGDLEEMWKINKEFIDKQKGLGKEFYLSHDPTNPNFYNGFYKKEIDYLTNPVNQGGLGGTIVDQGNNLWKLVW